MPRASKLKDKSLVKQIRKLSKKPIKEIENEIDPKNLIPTGSALFNLMLSDHEQGGFGKGKVVNLIGDSFAGKTVFLLDTFAEICKHKRFEKYILKLNEPESALEFNIKKMFGSSLVKRLDIMEPPSLTVQDFQNDILDMIEKDKPFIYGLDSLDSLTTEEELAKADDKRKGKKTSGSYGMEKAKIIGQMLRMIVAAIKETDSLLIIISQTRDNINPMSFTNKTRSGGKALKFYSAHEIWMAVGKQLKEKDRQVGINTVIKVTKNKLTGKLRKISVPVLIDYGVDNIGSCIDFMIEEKAWPKTKNTIEAKGLKINGTRLSLIKQIEEGDMERDLFKLVGDKWREIEESVRVKRKPRYR